MTVTPILLVLGILALASSTTLPPDCGGTLQASVTTNYLTSPGYPSGYPNNRSCTWVIQASPPTSMIRIVVVDSELQYEMFCKYDSVKVYDGPTTHSRHINTWCGTMTPTVQGLHGNMTLIFKTNYNITSKGFKLKYFSTTARYHCGANLTANNTMTTLLSPGYPNMYQNDARCLWTITAAVGEAIRVTFLDSFIESNIFCKYDWARVLDGSSTSSPELGRRVCGVRTPTFTSSGNSVTIEFHSNAEVVYKGYKLQYHSGIFQKCTRQSMIAHTDSSYLTSLGYPQYYQGPSQVDCTWLIDTQSDDYIVSVTVYRSEMDNCSNTYMEAFDGSSDSSSSLDRWCGNARLSIDSTGRTVFLKYHTSSDSPRTRFKMKYSAKPIDTKSFVYKPLYGAISGGVVGGLVVIVVVIVVIVYITERQSKGPTKESSVPQFMKMN